MSETPEEPAGPYRVIGTPFPAPKAVDVPVEPTEPAFSAEPPAPRHAKNAERLVAALFILAFLAGVAFIWAFVAIEIGVSHDPEGRQPGRRGDAVQPRARHVALCRAARPGRRLDHLGAAPDPEHRDRGGAARPAVRAAGPQGVLAELRRGRGDLAGHQAAADAPHAAARDRAAGARAAGAAARPRPAAADRSAPHGLAQGAEGGDARRAAPAAFRGHRNPGHR